MQVSVSTIATIMNKYHEKRHLISNLAAISDHIGFAYILGGKNTESRILNLSKFNCQCLRRTFPNFATFVGHDVDYLGRAKECHERISHALYLASLCAQVATLQPACQLQCSDQLILLSVFKKKDEKLPLFH